MIEFTHGDIFKDQSEAIVNTVNCVGAMGAGIAWAYKRKYPVMFQMYREACRAKQVKIGRMFVFRVDSDHDPKWVINFPTKQHWIKPSKIEYIEAGLKSLVEFIDSAQIKSIAMTPLGCAHGGLNWDDVKQLLVATFEDHPVRARVYCPYRYTDENKNINVGSTVSGDVLGFWD